MNFIVLFVSPLLHNIFWCIRRHPAGQPKALLIEKFIIEKESTHERLRRNLWNLKNNGANKLSITNYIIPKDWNELSLEMKKNKINSENYW